MVVCIQIERDREIKKNHLIRIPSINLASNDVHEFKFVMKRLEQNLAVTNKALLNDILTNHLYNVYKRNKLNSINKFQ